MPLTDMCAVTMPASRRFYVHLGSLGFLVAAQPSMFDEVATALALSGASRALDQVVEDWAMLSPAGVSPTWTAPSLDNAATLLHDRAADALRLAFQRIVHLVPPRFGATALLLGASEQVNAWCFEDDYLTYATDESAAAIMYAETGSLRLLRGEIRRSPDYDTALQMISGPSLFLFDQRTGIGPGTALFYRNQAARLMRAYRASAASREIDGPALSRIVREYIGPQAVMLDGAPVVDLCLNRANLMVTALIRGMPRGPAGSPGSVLPPAALAAAGPAERGAPAQPAAPTNTRADRAPAAAAPAERLADAEAERADPDRLTDPGPAAEPNHRVPLLRWTSS